MNINNFSFERYVKVNITVELSEFIYYFNVILFKHVKFYFKISISYWYRRNAIKNYLIFQWIIFTSRNVSSIQVLRVYLSVWKFFLCCYQ